LGGSILMFKEFYMKNVFKVFGIIALVAVIGFSFAACGGDDDGGGGNNNVWGEWGDNITISVDDVGTVTVNINSASELDTAGVGYQFNGQKNETYKLTFQAWTKSGTRNLRVCFGTRELVSGSLNYPNQTLDISSSKQTYVFTYTTADDWVNFDLSFNCGGDVGEFYIKVISIEKVSTGGGNPVNPGGGGKDVLDKTTWKGIITGSAVNYTLTFNSPNFTMSGTDGLSVTGTYTISGSTVTLTATSGGTGSQTATLSGNTLNFNDGGPSLIKQ
jgi:hypothetical protein